MELREKKSSVGSLLGFLAGRVYGLAGCAYWSWGLGERYGLEKEVSGGWPVVSTRDGGGAASGIWLQS